MAEYDLLVSMRIVSIRRYPVKSMGGEALTEVDLDGRGLAGDRWHALEDEEGYFASGKRTKRFRRRDAVFDYTARTSPQGEVRVAGPGGERVVGDPVLDAELSQAMGVDVQVKPEATVPHQDMGAVSIVGTATLSWCAKRWGINAEP